MKKAFEKARKFVYRHARPLDLARWQFAFEDGDRERVLQALEAYQNPDGGFGHGLEPDFWNPNSTPVATWAATEYIREVRLSDARHPMIQEILRYLESGADFDENANQWLNVTPENNDYPVSCWWRWGESGSGFQYNPSAALAGFIIRYAEKDSALYRKGLKIAGEAMAYLKENMTLGDAHVVKCMIRLYEDCVFAKAFEPELPEWEALLKKQVNHSICRDSEAWFSQYQPKPSDFIRSADSPFLAGNEEWVSLECRLILAHQQEDGGFPVTWNWKTEYEREFAVSANWWRSCFAIENMRFLKAFSEKEK